MKKITLLSFSILFSLISMAQSSFQLGFRGTPNISWLKPDSKNVDADGAVFGFNYGVIADFNISDRYSFSTGVESATTGGKLNLKDIATSTEFKMKYVEVPLSLKLKTNQIGYITYYGQFGVGLGINYDAEAKFSSSLKSQTDENFNDHINLFRGSIIMGLGAEYNISGNTSIVFGLTFNNGVTNIFNKNGKDLIKELYQPGSAPNDQYGNYQEINLENTAKVAASDELKAISNYLGLNIGIIF